MSLNTFNLIVAGSVLKSTAQLFLLFFCHDYLFVMVVLGNIISGPFNDQVKSSQVKFIYLAHLKQPQLTKVMYKLKMQYKISSKYE